MRQKTTLFVRTIFHENFTIDFEDCKLRTTMGTYNYKIFFFYPLCNHVSLFCPFGIGWGSNLITPVEV